MILSNIDLIMYIMINQHDFFMKLCSIQIKIYFLVTVIILEMLLIYQALVFRPPCYYSLTENQSLIYRDLV